MINNYTKSHNKHNQHILWTLLRIDGGNPLNYGGCKKSAMGVSFLGGGGGGGGLRGFEEA